MAKYDKEARAFNLKKYNAKHRMFKVYLDKKEDAAIIEHLDSHKNKSKAIRKIMKGAVIPVANVTFDEAKLKELTDDIVRQIQNGELIMVTKSEWIPCSERLPEEMKQVLVWYEYYRFGDYNCMYQTYGFCYVRDGRWSSLINGESGWTDARIIAWQALPEPYESEVQNEGV